MEAKKIKAIKDNKSPGVDGIPPKLLMETVEGLSSLKHFKNDVDSIKTDVKCGRICFDDKTITQQHGDRIIYYERKEVAQQLEWDIDF